MNKIITYFIFLVFFSINIYSQFDEILKKIPGVDDIFEKAVTTSIKDAYHTAYWLNGLDRQLTINQNEKFSEDITDGYYRFKFNTFCLHAGTYAPTEGMGYLAAPLKGARADLIRNILSRYSEHRKLIRKMFNF
jgi:hypothetical protein